MSFIGRLVELGIARETTRGVGVSPTFWVPKTTFDFFDRAVKVRSAAGFGTIAGMGNQSLVALKSGEGILESDVYVESFGLFLFAVFGAISTATDTPESGANTHTYTVLNSNQHTTLTLTVLQATLTQKTFELALIDSFTLTIVPEDVVKLTVAFKSKSSQDTAVHVPSYTAQDKFLGRHVSIKFASVVGSLSAASATSIKKLVVVFTKNALLDHVIGTVEPEDVLNQLFTIRGEVELNYENDTFHDLQQDGTYRAVRIDMTNTDVFITGTTRPQFTLDLSRVDFEAWEPTRPNDAVSTQTLQFEALYDIVLGNVVNSCTLVNGTSSY